MSVEFHDRLRQRSTDDPQETTFLGQYQILSDDPVQLNGLGAKPGDYLVPDRSGSGWRASWAAGVRSRSGEFRCDEPLLQREYDSLLALGQLLQERIGRQPSWENWIRIAPLVPNVGDIAEMNERDRAIAEFLPHLQEVCRHPSVRLKEAIERLPVSRARRIPPRATEYLAAHPEDWQYRRLRSVVPKRILALIYDDEIDTYENRVAARLIRELDGYLRGRIDKLRKLLEQLKQSMKEHDSPTLGTTWRNDRVYELFAKGIGEEVEHPIEGTLARLTALHHDVRMLFDSPLYEAIPHQARTRVASTLRATNIFVNDRHYRHVGALWQEFGQPSETVSEYYDKMQRLCRGFDSFCVLLVCRALEQLGFDSASSGTQLKPEKVLKLRGPGSECVELEWRRDYTLIVKIEEEEHMHFIPLVAPLTAGTEEEIESFVQALTAPGASGSRQYGFDRPQRIILYPGDSSQREGLPTELRLRIQTIGNDLPPETTISAGLIPVSTYEVDSVERVARVLQWRLVGSRMLSYPPETCIPVKFRKELCAVAPWLETTERGRSARVLWLPTHDEEERLRQWMQDKKMELRRLGKDGERDAELLDGLPRDLQSAYSTLERLLCCPVCHRKNGRDRFEARDRGSFICACRFCESQWGINICGNCGDRYPFLSVANIPPTTEPRTAGWVDDVLGRDVLAVPCWLPSSTRSYICPWCRHCKNEERADSETCLRCGTTARSTNGSSMEVP